MDQFQLGDQSDIQHPDSQNLRNLMAFGLELVVVVVGNYPVVVEQDKIVVAAWVDDKCYHKHAAAAAVEHNYCSIDDFHIDFYSQ